MDMNGAFTDGLLRMHTRVADVHLRDLMLDRHIKLEELLSANVLSRTFLTFSCCVVHLLNYCLVQSCDVIIVLSEHGILLFLNFLKAQ